MTIFGWKLSYLSLAMAFLLTLGSFSHGFANWNGTRFNNFNEDRLIANNGRGSREKPGLYEYNRDRVKYNRDGIQGRQSYYQQDNYNYVYPRDDRNNPQDNPTNWYFDQNGSVQYIFDR